MEEMETENEEMALSKNQDGNKEEHYLLVCFKLPSNIQYLKTATILQFYLVGLKGGWRALVGSFSYGWCQHQAEMESSIFSFKSGLIIKSG